jgi:hypothetical protein
MSRPFMWGLPNNYTIVIHGGSLIILGHLVVSPTVPGQSSFQPSISIPIWQLDAIVFIVGLAAIFFRRRRRNASLRRNDPACPDPPTRIA